MNVASSRTPDATHNRPWGGGSAAVDPRVLMRIKSLSVRARVAVDGFLKGIHRSPYHGFSVEFSEYRQYSPGDDHRFLDWRLFARTDRYFVKRFEDETNLRCTIVMDSSRSMGYGSGSYTKADYARTAAATIAYFLTLQRDAVGLATFEERITDYAPARHRPGHFRRLLGMLEREPSGRKTDLANPLEQLAATVRKRGLLVVLSDFLAEIEPLRTRLGYLRSCGHDVIMIRVLDPAEVDLRIDRPSLFIDVESNREMYVDPEIAREGYRARFGSHAKKLETACTELGIDYASLTIDQPLERVLYELLKARGRRPRSLGRRVGGVKEAAR